MVDAMKAKRSINFATLQGYVIFETELYIYGIGIKEHTLLNFKQTIRHFSLLNVKFAGACGHDFLCDGRRLVRAYLRRRRGAI